MKIRPIPMIKPFWLDIAKAMVEYIRSGQYRKDCLKWPILWGSPDDERLEYIDEDEAIEEILDDIDGPLPEAITICGFARIEINTLRLHPLEDCLDTLDEDYGDPDGEPAHPTEAMKEAERVFLETIKKEYTPWMCEEVCRKEISVADWVKENRPDWLQSS